MNSLKLWQRQTHLETLEALAALVGLLLLAHGRPHIRVYHVCVLHCLHDMS